MLSFDLLSEPVFACGIMWLMCCVIIENIYIGLSPSPSHYQALKCLVIFHVISALEASFVIIFFKDVIDQLIDERE